MKKVFSHVETSPKTFCTVVKAKIASDIISVKAQIGNTPAHQNFMFDTGAPLMYKFKTKDSFNIAAKKLLRIGLYKADYGIGSINFGNVVFNSAGFLVSDQILGEYKEVDGIIGSSMLQTSICELNFADSTIKISNDLKNFTNIENCYSSAFELYGTQAIPVVKIVIGKDTSTAFIDTGFSGMIRLNGNIKIPAEEARQKESYRNVRYFGIAKKDYFINTNYYQIRRLEVSGIKMDSIMLRQDPKYYGINCVGLAFLKKFIITIDWIHHRIYFKPIENTHFLKNIYTYGFNCDKYNNQLRVLDIYKGSEAEKAGIKSGDVIVSINKNKDLSDLIISTINSYELVKDSIQIEIKDKPMLTLKKYKLFN